MTRHEARLAALERLGAARPMAGRCGACGQAGRAAPPEPDADAVRRRIVDRLARIASHPTATPPASFPGFVRCQSCGRLDMTATRRRMAQREL